MSGAFMLLRSHRCRDYPAKLFARQGALAQSRCEELMKEVEAAFASSQMISQLFSQVPARAIHGYWPLGRMAMESAMIRNISELLDSGHNLVIFEDPVPDCGIKSTAVAKRGSSEDLTCTPDGPKRECTACGTPHRYLPAVRRV